MNRVLPRVTYTNLALKAGRSHVGLEVQSGQMVTAGGCQQQATWLDTFQRL